MAARQPLARGLAGAERRQRGGDGPAQGREKVITRAGVNKSGECSLPLAAMGWGHTIGPPLAAIRSGPARPVSGGSHAFQSL